MTWEGEKNKMVHAYALCLLDYDFHVLNNAFVIHRPGIKRSLRENVSDYEKVLKQETAKLLSTKIKYEMKSLYGDREECQINYS